MNRPLTGSRKTDAATGIDRLVWLLIAALLLSHLHLATQRLYDPDEFEHLHAGLSLSQGLVPYRDFFEHHGPLTYFLSVPAAWSLGPSIQLLTANRLLSFAFVVLTLVGAYRLTRRTFGARAGQVALLWLLTFPWFVEKCIEWRPDVPAMCLVVWAAWFAGRKSPSAWSVGLPCGLLLGLASLATQKVVFLGLGIFAAAAAERLANRKPLAWQVVATATGFLVPWLAFGIWFWSHDALNDVARCLVYYPLTWPEHAIDPAETFLFHLMGRGGWAPAHQGLALVGLVGGILRAFSRRARRRGELMLTLPPLLHLLAVPITPATYLQYYLLSLPILAGLAGGMTAICWNTARAHLASRPKLRLAWLPLATCIALYGIELLLRYRDLDRGLHDRFDLIGVGLIIVGLIALPLLRWPAMALLWIAVLTPSLGRIAVYHLYWPNAGQRRAVELVNSLVGPDQTVLDGFTGLGCLRPHAFYWWWINLHNMGLLEREGALPDLERLIASGGPAVILYDSDLSKLKPILNDPIVAGYRPIARQPAPMLMVFLRRDLPDPTAAQKH